MSKFEELYKVFMSYKFNDKFNKYLEYDDANKTFWLVWGDDSLYE